MANRVTDLSFLFLRGNGQLTFLESLLQKFLHCCYFLDRRTDRAFAIVPQNQHPHGIGYHVLSFRIHVWILVLTSGCRYELANGPWKLSTEPPFLLDITNEGPMKNKCRTLCVTNIPTHLGCSSSFYLILLQQCVCQKATNRSIVSLKARHSLQNEIMLQTERLNLLSNSPIIRAD